MHTHDKKKTNENDIVTEIYYYSIKMYWKLNCVVFRIAVSRPMTTTTATIAEKQLSLSNKEMSLSSNYPVNLCIAKCHMRLDSFFCCCWEKAEWKCDIKLYYIQK